MGCLLLLAVVARRALVPANATTAGKGFFLSGARLDSTSYVYIPIVLNIADRRPPEMRAIRRRAVAYRKCSWESPSTPQNHPSHPRTGAGSQPLGPSLVLLPSDSPPVRTLAPRSIGSPAIVHKMSTPSWVLRSRGLNGPHGYFLRHQPSPAVTASGSHHNYRCPEMPRFALHASCRLSHPCPLDISFYFPRRTVNLYHCAHAAQASELSPTRRRAGRRSPSVRCWSPGSCGLAHWTIHPCRPAWPGTVIRTSPLSPSGLTAQTFEVFCFHCFSICPWRRLLKCGLEIDPVPVCVSRSAHNSKNALQKANQLVCLTEATYDVVDVTQPNRDTTFEHRRRSTTSQSVGSGARKPLDRTGSSIKSCSLQAPISSGALSALRILPSRDRVL